MAQSRNRLVAVIELNILNNDSDYVSSETQPPASKYVALNQGVSYTDKDG